MKKMSANLLKKPVVIIITSIHVMCVLIHTQMSKRALNDNNIMRGGFSFALSIYSTQNY